MLVLFFWGRSPISPQRRKERRKSFHLRFLFLMRLWNLLMYKKKWYLFFFHWHLMKRSTLSSCLISRMPNLFESSLPRGQGSIFWGTWIVEMAGSGLDWTQFKAPLFLRTSSWGNIYAGNSLWSLLASLWISHPPTVSIHMCSLALGWYLELCLLDKLMVLVKAHSVRSHPWIT